MPRRSTASATTAATHAAGSSTMSASASTTAPSNLDGDTSILSVATTTDVSPSSRGAARTSTKAEKADGHADGTGIDDLLLPRTLTSRLARGTLPPNTSIQKDALLALTKAASVFISYVASQANEATTKKTIGPQDVLKALQEMEMGAVMGLGEVGPDGKVVGGRLERELEAWETVVRGKRKGYREKVKQRESGVGGAGGGSEAGDGDGGSNKERDGEGDERRAKRARVEESADESAGRTEGYHDAPSVVGGQSAVPQSQSQRPPRTNGAPKDGQARGDLHNEEGGDGDAYYDDETQPDDEEDDPDPDPDPEDEQDNDEDEDEDEDEEEDEDPALDDEEELEGDGGYGPDDQLRHDMNHGGGDETADESD